MLKHHWILPHPHCPCAQHRAHRNYSAKHRAFWTQLFWAYNALWVCHLQSHWWHLLVHRLGSNPRILVNHSRLWFTYILLVWLCQRHLQPTPSRSCAITLVWLTCNKPPPCHQTSICANSWQLCILLGSPSGICTGRLQHVAIIQLATFYLLFLKGFRMSDMPPQPDPDQCVLDKNGQLKDTKYIMFFHSPCYDPRTCRAPIFYFSRALFPY